MSCYRVITKRREGIKGICFGWVNLWRLHLSLGDITGTNNITERRHHLHQTASMITRYSPSSRDEQDAHFKAKQTNKPENKLLRRTRPPRSIKKIYSIPFRPSCLLNLRGKNKVIYINTRIRLSEIINNIVNRLSVTLRNGYDRDINFFTQHPNYLVGMRTTLFLIIRLHFSKHIIQNFILSFIRILYEIPITYRSRYYKSQSIFKSNLLI